MRPIFTIHAGEYLVATHIEEHFKDLRVWVPSKDEGVDLLVTNKNRTKTVAVQVKFSKDFLPNIRHVQMQAAYKACGWWTHNRAKIKKSTADIWIFLLPSFETKENFFVIIRPQDLLKRLKKLHGNTKLIHSYFWITKNHRCWEARGLSKRDRLLIAGDTYKNPARDFSQYLNNWPLLKKV